MQRLLLMIGILFVSAALNGRAMAQSSDAPSGTVVSNTSGEHLKLIGRELPEVGKKVGKPINLPNNNALMRPYNPANPYEQFQGTNLNPNSVVAPVNGYSSAVQPSMYQQVINSIKSLAGLSTQPTVVTPRTFTPGIFRRDRERVQERMWVRD